MGFKEYNHTSATTENEEKFWRELKGKVDEITFQEIRDYYTKEHDRSVFDNNNYSRFKKAIYKKFDI